MATRCNVTARCAILTDHIFKICIGPHDCVDIDLVSHRGIPKLPAAAIGIWHAVWFEPEINMLKTCTPRVSNLGQFNFPKITQRLSSICLLTSHWVVYASCFVAGKIDLNMHTPRAGSVVMDVV